MRPPPWTDGRADQNEYQDAILLWKAFHSALPANNSNNIPARLQVFCLKAQLFGRSKDLKARISNQHLMGDDGVSLLVIVI